MIIIRISGGLGNQLFQYAFARSIKERTGLDVRLDTEYYDHQKPSDAPRTFLLDKFFTTLPKATEHDKQQIGFTDVHQKTLPAILRRKILTIIDSLKPLNQRKFIIEPSFTYHSALSGDIRDDSYLSGIWQSEKYFKSIEHIVRKEFALKNPLSADAQKVHTFISEKNSVSLHIRRGDYTTLQKIQTLPLEYYQKAIAYIQEHVTSPHYFIFSDDIEWVQQHLIIPGEVTFVSGMGTLDYEELVLMSACNHNIVANSTFSWWGAWLNNNSNKIVITPKKWFSIAIDTQDLIPQQWVRL